MSDVRNVTLPQLISWHSGCDPLQRCKENKGVGAGEGAEAGAGLGQKGFRKGKYNRKGMFFFVMIKEHKKINNI